LIALGFLGKESTAAVTSNQPSQVDAGLVIVKPDEVKTKAQPHTGRKEIWTYTAVVLVAERRYVFAEATPQGLWEQLAGLLCGLGVAEGRRQLLVLGNGSAWIRAWFEALKLPGKAMILSWDHLGKRCYEWLSAVGCTKRRRQEIEKHLLGLLWEGRVDAAVRWLRACRAEIRHPRQIDKLIDYLEDQRPYIPDYKGRRAAGLWIASDRVEEFDNWSVSLRRKHRGTGWTTEGVLALAALETARRNGELDAWRKRRQLPAWRLPDPQRRVARGKSGAPSEQRSEIF
jgi:hypothetical protein